MDERSRDEPVRPRAEPEIIPPGQAYRRPVDDGERARVLFGGRESRYIKFTSPGPFALLMTGLVLGAAAVAVLVLLLGALLISVPVIGAIAAAVIFSQLVRAHARRLR
jgi:hypothetical protein